MIVKYCFFSMSCSVASCVLGTPKNVSGPILVSQDHGR